MAYVQLVRYQCDAWSKKPSATGLDQSRVVSQRLIAKVKPLISVYLVGKEAILGFVETHLLLKTGFNEDLLLPFGNSVIDDQIIHVRQRGNLKDPALVAFDLIAGIESDPGKGSLPLRIGPTGTTDGKVNGDLPAIKLEYLTHSQFRFCIADPALTQAEWRQTIALR
jgi:hypothetical protein